MINMYIPMRYHSISKVVCVWKNFCLKVWPIFELTAMPCYPTALNILLLRIVWRQMEKLSKIILLSTESFQNAGEFPIPPSCAASNTFKSVHFLFIYFLQYYVEEVTAIVQDLAHGECLSNGIFIRCKAKSIRSNLFFGCW